MKLTVTTPCFQEIRFVRAWLQNLRDWGADQVIVSEGGSTDGTREIIEQHQRLYGYEWLIILDSPQPADPMRYGFHEGARRQQMNEMVKDGIQIFLDVDEMLPDDTRTIIEECLPPGCCGAFNALQFWRSPNYIRIGTPEDEHWGPLFKWCVFPAGGMTWRPMPNHSEIVTTLPMARMKGAKFHLHYLYGTPKAFENRIGEFKGLAGAMATVDIRLRPIRAEMPKAFALLEDHCKFAEMMK